METILHYGEYLAFFVACLVSCDARQTLSKLAQKDCMRAVPVTIAGAFSYPARKMSPVVSNFLLAAELHRVQVP